MSKTTMKNKSFSVLSLTALLLLMSSLSISVKNEPGALQSEYSVGIGQPAMAFAPVLGTKSRQYPILVNDAGVCSTWRDMVNRANANNAKKGIRRRYGVASILNPVTRYRIDIGFTANF